MKRPASQYYWGDWRRDTALQACSLAARGLWHEMNCLMHDCEPYGHLCVGTAPMQPAQLARLVGIAPKECAALLAELEAACIFSRTEAGVIFSRRMVRDEDLRERRAAGGSAGAEHGIKGADHGAKGGRPKRGKGGYETPLHPAQEPPPAFASASANTEPDGSVEAAKPPRATRKAPTGFEPEDPQAWIGEHCPGVDWQTETAKFRDHTFKTALSDWQGAWRNWMRRAAEFRPAQRPAALSFRERDQQAAAERMAQIAPAVAARRPQQPTAEVFDVTARLLG